jgi:hypothetical protein
MTPQESLRDIRGPVALVDPTWWFAGGILLVLLAIALFFWIRRHRAGKPPLPPPVVHPGKTALEALDRLGQGKWSGPDGIKAYYSALSSIVRTYIEARFNIRAPEMTSDEFMDAAQRSPLLTAPHQAFLSGFLVASDMVKFARDCPLPSDMKAACEAAARFVRETWN